MYKRPLQFLGKTLETSYLKFQRPSPILKQNFGQKESLFEKQGLDWTYFAMSLFWKKTYLGT